MAAILGDPEALAAEVSRRAHHKAVEIAEEARRNSAAILQGAQEQVEAIRLQSEQAIAHQTAALQKRIAARADLEAQRRFVLLRETPIGHVWRAAEERLRSLVQRPNYRDILKQCAFRAARELGATDLELAADPTGHPLLSPETLDRWSNEAGVRFHRAHQPAATWGGLVATCGRLRFDATFQTQLAIAQAALRERVFEILSQELK